MEQGRLSYGWRRVKILNGGRAIGSAKKEGRNSYRGVWYFFYSKLLKPTGPRDGPAVLQLHPALGLLHHRARQHEHTNAKTMDGSAQGATAGLSVATRDSLCHPQLWYKAFWVISHGARTRPPTTHAQQPRPFDCRYIRPYRRYWRPGPGSGVHGGGGERPQGPKGGGERRRGGGGRKRGM